jgi:hypothetical protein
MMFRPLVLSLAVAIVACALAVRADGPPPFFSATPLPPVDSWGACPDVDEPLGPTYSIGLTPWHLGRSPETISRFQDFAKAKFPSLKPATPPAPESLVQILLEPELMADAALPGWGWKKNGAFLAGSNADDGPDVSLPLHVPRDGFYRLGIRYEGWTNMTGGTRLRLYAKGREGDGPLLNEEYYHQPAKTNGLNWHTLMTGLKSGDYVLTFSHVVRQWQAPQSVGYAERRIDCLFLTDAWMADLPGAKYLDEFRKAVPPEGIQRTRRIPLGPASQAEWNKRSLRPADWNEARANPALFAATYAFWRHELDRLAADEQAGARDYRDPARQIVFDDVWNLLGNPARIARQIRELGSDVRSDIKPHRHYFVNASRMEERAGPDCDWWDGGEKLVSGTYYNFQGEAVYAQSVEPGRAYHLWVQFRNMGYFEPWQIRAAWQGNPTNLVHWKRDQRNYPPDIDPQRSWVRIGAVDVPAGATNTLIRWRLANLPWPNLQGVSYRQIFNFHLTSDPDYIPRGRVMPPLSSDQYLARARELGAAPGEAFLCQFVDPSPLGQAWWPGPVAGGSPSNALVLAAGTFQSAQLGFRSIVDEPVSVTVQGGRLEGDAGSITGAVAWRTVAYAPYGPTRATWTGWSLLRRPYITVPPFNTAALWLTVNATGVKPGAYTATLTLTARGRLTGKRYAARTAVLRVRVSPVRPEPRSPTLVHGYTMPPEGEAYLRDYQAHGFRVWCGNPISREEMARRGMRLQQIRARALNGDYKPLADSIKALGLQPADYYTIVWDEPSGATEAELGKFIASAKRLRELEPGLRRAFNPGEPATLKTFQLLDPFCEIWMPYTRHFVYHPNEAAAKTALITAKPWMEYTTPCYGDKEPGMPGQLYGQIRKVPANPGPCIGTWFFALYYPFRDPWDAENEHLKDASVFVLPSRSGPVATIGWERMRDAIHHADLAQLVKERAAADDKDARALVAGGSVGSLLEWLEAHP